MLIEENLGLTQENPPGAWKEFKMHWTWGISWCYKVTGML